MVAELVLNGVFYGDDVTLLAIQFVQAGVQRGRFAASGRPGHEDQAVGGLHGRGPVLQQVRRHSEFFQLHFRAHRVEDTHHDLFAVQSGQHGHTGAELARAVFHVQTPVLRFAPFVYVHSRRQLQASEDVGNQVGAHLPHVLHHAVNTVAYEQAVALRLQMHVGRAQVEGFAQEKVGLRHGLGEFAAHFAGHAILPHDQFKLLRPATRHARATAISHLCHGNCSLKTEENGKERKTKKQSTTRRGLLREL